MIKAVNRHGATATFSEKVWNLLPPHKNGWMIADGSPLIPKNIVIPKDLIEYTKKKEESVKTQETKAPSTAVELRAYLTEKGIPFDEKDGYLKLKKLYNESQKP